VDEATRRHAVTLSLSPMPTPMPVAYIAQRLDTDDPLWGWQVRDQANGWLQVRLEIALDRVSRRV
jgi:hypothetical protein